MFYERTMGRLERSGVAACTAVIVLALAAAEDVAVSADQVSRTATRPGNRGDCTHPLFDEEVVYPAGRGAERVATGDLDGDLDLDLVVTNSSHGDVSVLLGNGDGTFAADTRVVVGARPGGVALGDLDGDLDLDLVVTISRDDVVAVLLGNGDGTFALGTRFAVGDEPAPVALGDLDGDLDLDLVVSNRADDDVSVLLNDGNGIFAAGVRYDVGDRPNGLALGDLDGDEDLDLVVANNEDDDFSVLFNHGDGTMAPGVRFDAQKGPNGVAIGDLDGDLDLDVAIVNEDVDRISVFANDGNGVFPSAAVYGAGNEGVQVAMADFDGNGSLDLVSSNLDGDNVSMLLNNGDGTFAARVFYGTGDRPAGLAIGDLDGDFKTDVVTASNGDDSISVLLNRCEPATECGDFPCGPDDDNVLLCHVHVVPGKTAHARTLCLSPDAAAAHMRDHEGDHCGPCEASALETHQKISDTEGGFEGVLDDGDRFSAACGIGDVDGDGIPDLAVGSPFDDDGGTDRGAVWILYLNADGTVKDHRKISDTAGGFDGTLRDQDHFGFAVAPLGDLDGEGPAEWALAVGAIGLDQRNVYGRSDESVWVLFMAGDGTVLGYEEIHHPFRDASGGLDYCSDGEHGFALSSLGDLDGDGVVDLAVGSPGEGWENHGFFGAVRILFLNRDGTWKHDSWVGVQYRWICGVGGADSYMPLGVHDDFGSSVTTLGDLDGDGIVDLAVGASGDDDGGRDRGAMYVLFLNTDGTVREYQKISDTAGGFEGILDDHDTFGRTATALGDLDGDGVVDLAVGASGDDDGGDAVCDYLEPCTDRGALWLLFLNPDGTVKDHHKLSDTAGGFYGVLDDDDSFGIAPALLGDLDGDGVQDLAVGALGDDDGGVDRGAVWVLFVDRVVDGARAGVATPSGTTSTFRLSAGTPSPFRRFTTIRYEVTQPSVVELGIYDVQGRLVRTLHSGLQVGLHAVTWEGRDGLGSTIAPGTYFIRMESAGGTDTQRIVFLGEG